MLKLQSRSWRKLCFTILDNVLDITRFVKGVHTHKGIFERFGAQVYLKILNTLKLSLASYRYLSDNIM